MFQKRHYEHAASLMREAANMGYGARGLNTLYQAYLLLFVSGGGAFDVEGFHAACFPEAAPKAKARGKKGKV